MKPGIRLARHADLDAVAAIAAACPSAAGWTNAQFAAELEHAGARFVVIGEEGAIAGYAIFRRVLKEAQILDVAVDPKRQRKGLGLLLLKDLLDRARTAGCKTAMLEVRADNAAALALYKSAGFVVVGRRPNFYNGVCDAVLMDRNLS